MTFPVKIVSTHNTNFLEITWNPNNVCNFKCRYCFPESNWGDYKSPTDLGLILKNFDHFLTEYKNKLGKTDINLKIAGGEPTLWKDLGTFILEIKKKHNLYITLISNGSRTLRWWEKHGHLIDNITLSYHVSETNIDHHISVADIMSRLGKKTTVIVLMDPLKWDECVNAISYMRKHSNYPWFIQTTEVIEPERITTGKTNQKYTEEQKKFMRWEFKKIPNILWFLRNYKLILSNKIRVYESIAELDNGRVVKSRPQTYINNNWNSFKGWSCDLGSDTVVINWTGEITGSCRHKLYGLDYYYNILDEEFVNKFNLDFKPIICQNSKCYCTPEMHISKRRFR